MHDKSPRPGISSDLFSPLLLERITAFVSLGSKRVLSFFFVSQKKFCFSPYVFEEHMLCAAGEGGREGGKGGRQDAGKRF